MTIRNLRYMFEPRSLAIIGASPNEQSVGFMVRRNLQQSGFSGPVWLVNPHHKDIEGAPCYPNVTALPGAPELAIIATPAPTVPGLIAALASKGTRAAVVLSAGIGETDGLRQAMLDASQDSCLRIVGPNCLGIFVPKQGLNASFAHLAPMAGRLALLSQSGAVASAIIDWAASHDIGFSHIVSLGDMADVDIGDMLDYLASERTAEAILIYMETIKNPRKFMSAARSAARVKPVVLVKAGRNEAAAKAAATHTGALAGNDQVADAAFRRAGLLRVDTLEELFDAAETLTRLKGATGERLAIVTNGGGAGVLAVETLTELDGQLARLSAETIARLDKLLPANWSKMNPVDIIGDAGPERYQAAIDAVLDDPGVDALLAMNCPTALASSLDAAEAVIATLASRCERLGAHKPILTNWLGESTAQRARERFAAAGVATYSFPNDAIRSFAHYTAYAKAQRALMRTPPSLPEDFAVDSGVATTAIASAKNEGRELLTEPEAKAVLAAYGIPVVRTEIASDEVAVEASAARLLKDCQSVVVKVLSHDISHKSDIGGVVLDIKSSEAAREAAEDIRARIAEQRPDARIEGFTVQEMVHRPIAHELIIGVTEDKIFGPALMFGAGGTSVEVVGDTAVALPPLDLQLAQDLIGQTRIAKLLGGYRDRAAADRDAIALTLMRISQLVIDIPAIAELDINPLLADENGVIALDARIKLDWSFDQSGKQNPRLAIRPYPRAWEKTASTLSGRALKIRPVKPTDEDAFGDFLGAITPQDWRLRFFSSMRHLDHDFLARFTQIDYARAIAFLAIDPATEEVLGSARLVADPDHVSSEFGVLVRSALKGEGIGWVLMRHLIDYGRADGLREIRGDILAENTQMVNMCRELGFRVTANTEDPTLLQVILELTGL